MSGDNRSDSSIPLERLREHDDSTTFYHSQPYVFNNENVKLITRITGQDHNFRWTRRFVNAEFTLERSDGHEHPCGVINAFTFDREQRNLDMENYNADEINIWYLPRRPRKLWMEELLTEPSEDQLGSDSDIRGHAFDTDTISEEQRCFTRLFDKHGNVRPEVQGMRDELATSPDVHYISKYEINKRYHGTGIAQLALETYLSLLPRLGGRTAFEQGPVVLSPGPIYAVTEQMQKEKKKKVGEYNEIVAALVRSYSRVGFEILRADDPTVPYSITMMGVVIPKPSASSIFARSITLPPLSADAEPSQEQPSPAELQDTRLRRPQKPVGRLRPAGLPSTDNPQSTVMSIEDGTTRRTIRNPEPGETMELDNGENIVVRQLTPRSRPSARRSQNSPASQMSTDDSHDEPST